MAMDVISEALIVLQDKTLEVGVYPRRFDKWSDDDGDVIWWNVEHTNGEIMESPNYLGSPLDHVWPFMVVDRPHLLWVPLPKLASNKP